MRDLVTFAIFGLTSGAVYSLAALGLVVTYKTSGIFNFAHGAAGMVATYVFVSLREDAGLPTAVALVGAVFVFAPACGLLIDRVVLRGLAGAPAATAVVASLGLLVALQGLSPIIWGAEAKAIDPFLPTSSFGVSGVRVGWDQVIIVAVSVAAALLLALLFSRTHLGLATRAVVDDGELCELHGTDTRRVMTFSWMLGTSFAALSGILLAPQIGLDAAILTLLVVQAFGAAAVGRLTSLPLTYLGGIGIGVAAALIRDAVADHPALAGLPSSLPFIVLFVVLVVSPRGSFTEVTKVRALAPVLAPRGTSSVITGVTALAAAVALPFVLPGSRILTATATLAFVLIFASLGLLVGLSRQVSLCHAVFVGLGAATTAHLLDAGVPFTIALPLAAACLVPVGAVLAIPAIRLSGVFLALATFGFGQLAQSLLYPTSLGFGKTSTVDLGRPSLFGADFEGDRAYYLFVLGVVVLGLIAIEAVRRARLGRLLRAMADSPIAVESVGVSVTAARVLTFCMSTFLAAVAGGLLGSLYRSVNTVSFDVFQSLIWVAVLVTAGATGIVGAVVAAVLFVAVPAIWTGAVVREWQPVVFGVAAILLAKRPNGLVGLLQQDWSGLAARRAWRRERTPGADRRRPRPGSLPAPTSNPALVD